MDEYHCDAYPNFSFTDYDTQNISSNPNDKYFNIELECTNMFVLNARKFETYSEKEHHTLSNVSKDELMQETTIISWLSQTDIPQDAFRVVVSKLVECARDMVNRTHKNLRVLPIRVDLVVTRASEDESDEEDNYFEVDDESDEEDNGFEVDDESYEADNGLVPAAKSCVEGLKEVEKKGKCAICFENFEVCVGMPCLHMFHLKCLCDWLEIGNSCPLCRFKLPTSE